MNTPFDPTLWKRIMAWTFPTLSEMKRTLSAMMLLSAAAVPALASGSLVMKDYSTFFDADGTKEQFFLGRVPGAFFMVVKNRDLVYRNVPDENYSYIMKETSYTVLCKIKSENPERRHLIYLGNVGEEITLTSIDSDQCDKPFDPEKVKLKIVRYSSYSQKSGRDEGYYESATLGKDNFHIITSHKKSEQTNSLDPQVSQLLHLFQPLFTKKIVCKETSPTRKLIDEGGRHYTLSFDAPFDDRHKTPAPFLILIDECDPMDALENKIFKERKKTSPTSLTIQTSKPDQKENQ